MSLIRIERTVEDTRGAPPPDAANGYWTSGLGQESAAADRRSLAAQKPGSASLCNLSSTDPIVVNSSGTGSTAVAISLPFTDSDPSATNSAVIDWGDGTTDSPDTSTGTVTESAGSGTVTGSHSYADGTYTATVTITNNATGAVPVATPIEIEAGGATDPTTGDPYYSDVANLTPGANLGLRFRADNTDGTVSPYANTNLAGPAAQSPSSSGPVISVSANQDPGPPNWPQGGWSGTVSTTLQNSPYANTGVNLIGQRADDPFGVLSNYNDSDNNLDEPELSDDLFGIGGGNFGPASGLPNSQSAHVEAFQGGGDTESPGETYNIDGTYWDSTDPGNDAQTPFTTSTKITVAGTPLPKLDIKQNGVDSHGNPIITWTTPAGVSDPGSVYLYYVHKDANGNLMATCLNGGPAADQWPGTDMEAGSCTVTLPTGKWQVFAVYENQLQITNEAYSITAFSPYSKDVTVTAGGPPAAPAGLTAADETGAAGNWQPTVELHWTNSSNNETGFLIGRKSNGGQMKIIGWAPKDQTTFTDHPTDYGPWTYEVWAVNGAGSSGGVSASTKTNYVICLLRGDNTTSQGSAGDPIVNQLHESVGAGVIVNGKYNIQAAFSFGVDGTVANFPNEKQWLGWNLPTEGGAKPVGTIYQTDNFYKAIEDTKFVTGQQETSWVKWMENTRVNTPPDIYSNTSRSCRTYSELEFADAPGNH